MKTLHVNKNVNIDALTDQLFDRFPEWTHEETLPVIGNIQVTEVQIVEDDNGQWQIHFPDFTEMTDVQDVVNDHNDSDIGKREALEIEEAKNRTTGKAKLSAMGLTDKEIAVIYGDN
jgi:uncharacterized membrane protein